MRPALFLLLVGLSGCGSASGFRTDANPVPEDSLSREVILDVPGVAQADAFDRLRRWVSVAYFDAGQVIQSEDREAGLLVWRFTARAMPHVIVGSIPYEVLVEVDVRDGRARWRDRLGPHPVRQGPVSNRSLLELREQVDALRASALSAMQTADDF